MKKCPKCQKTFDDGMRFCQSDGTPLVDDAPPVDPYKTMVASSQDISAAMGAVESAGTAPGGTAEEEVLQLPAEADPKKTMYVSEEELRKEMGVNDEPVVELPPLAPEPPKFSEPSLNPPSFGDVSPSSPPPSPLSPGGEGLGSQDLGGDPPFMKTTPPIPSPFSERKEAVYDQPASYSLPEPGPAIETSSAPLEPLSPSIEAEASAPVQNLEPNEPMQNIPVAGPAGQNKTLAIVSLVLGILSILCCGWFIPGIVAIILGFMAKSKATNDPANYGGRGLALGGIITGVFSVVLGVIVVILYFLGFAAGFINPNAF